MSLMFRRNPAVRQAPVFDGADIQGRVNGVLASTVGTIFCAGTPALGENGGNWRVPILYATPGFVVDEVGEALVDASTAEILSLTKIELLHQHVRKLGKQHSAEIEAAFSRTRKG